MSLPDQTARPATEVSLLNDTREPDTLGSTPCTVPLAQIHPYERNPRLSPNPEYDRIKDSIRQHGLDQPLVITQRSGTSDYIVHSGGNTRLKVLKELCEESADPQHAQVPCLFRPWRSESDVLLAHLRENDIRGGLTFIDKARAVHEAKQLLGNELGLNTISIRRLETELRKAGYRLSSSAICLMAYAVETLLPLIPQALEGGLGKHQVRRIRALERAARTLWQRVGGGGEPEFDGVFAALCRRYDGLDWSTEVLQEAIETEIAEATDTSIHTLRVALDAELEGRELVIPDFIPIKAPPSPEREKQNPDEAHPVSTEGFDDIDVDETRFHPTGDAPADLADASTQPPDSLDGATADGLHTLIDADPSKPSDLKSLRGRAWTLAARLAQRNGLGELVVALPNKGLGYVLRDLPAPVLADQLDEQALAQLNLLWWQLAACAEMTHAPLEAILPALPGDSLLRRALETEDAGLLFDNIWTLDPGHTGYWLWYSLHERDWRDLICLMATYRHIRQLATETGTLLWA